MTFARTAWLTVAVAVIALAVRLFHLGSAGFWFDEIFTAQLTTFRTSLGAVVSHVASDDAHPPLHYVLSWLWAHLAGAYGGAYPQVEAGLEWRMRLSSVLTGVATAALLTWVAARRYGATAGSMAGLLAALHPMLVRQDQEFRMYPLLTLLTLVSGLLLDRALTRRTRSAWAWYAAALAALLYTHYLALFVVAAHLLLVLIRYREVNRNIWIAALGAAAYLPWLPVLLRSVTQGRNNPAVRPDTEFTMNFLVNALAWFDPDTLTAAARLLVVPLPWVLAAAGWWVLARPAGEGRRDLSLVVLGTAPLLLWYLTSKGVSNMMSPRYVGFILPFLLLSMAAAIGVARRRWRVAPGLIAAALVLSTGTGLLRLQSTHLEPWREMAAALNLGVRPGDEVLVTSDSRAAALAYYFRPPEGVTLASLEGVDAGALRAMPRVWLVTTNYRYGYGLPGETQLRALLNEPQTRLVVQHNAHALYVRQGGHARPH